MYYGSATTVGSGVMADTGGTGTVPMGSISFVSGVGLCMSRSYSPVISCFISSTSRLENPDIW